jgi:hypothetical protein
MDQAMERLLATPKTTAVRPWRSADMGGSPCAKGKEYQQRAEFSIDDFRLQTEFKINRKSSIGNRQSEIKSFRGYFFA